MTDRTDIDSILNSEPEAAPMAPMVQETQPQEPATGDKQPAAEPPAVAQQNAPEPATIPREALMDERRKRQELEKQYKELQARLTQQPQQEQPKPDWFTDPESAARAWQQETERQVFETRVQLSEMLVKDKFQDYEEKRDYFSQVAVEAMEKGNFTLFNQIRNAANPALFAYEMGKRIQLAREIGDNPDSYRTKLESEFRKKYGIPDEGGVAPQAQVPQRIEAPVPKSLARTPSAPSQPRAPNGQWTGRAPLEDLIG